MTITVRDILNLPIFKNVTIIAGKNGLDKRIKRISVFDIFTYDDDPQHLSKEGDFYLSGFYDIRNSIENQIQAINIMIKAGSCALCLIDSFVGEIHQEVKKVADDNDYPILVISGEIPYSEIIMDVMEAIIEDNLDTIKSLEIEHMLKESFNKNALLEKAYQINENFEKNVIILFYSDYAITKRYIERIKDSYVGHKEWTILKFRKGILFIITSNKRTYEDISCTLNYAIKTLGKDSTTYKIGISNYHLGLDKLNTALQEAVFSCDLAKIMDQKVVYYNKLGIYKFLTPLRHNPAIKNFHDEILQPIISYDEKNKSNLLETAVAFIDNDTDVKKTAQVLFQHENTIRYRIMKIKEIFDKENIQGNFIEQLSVAIKINKLY
ncbi:PucR family transcriptional regulator [Natronincola ferrireducens]|uniref:PucR C-terminal helix-turn-helix domain-containing protein n=1 Tax=Natronincola ferrireducens TaxID=393762 RepID=A0A1G9F4X9_9FIRM|nr:PucR family transcriptional regulator ligand-binding domain-containing protein [Natronincola ferrireducens]SDK83446.1 PucR C-terminal helix-turn-helix domain-containing protein [Natronincola ferrireducens]